MTRLLLVRHGETVDNVNKIMQGQTHGRLTLNGIEQAHELGRQLRGEHIDVFLSSDLARAVETLEIIKKETHPQTPPVKGKTHPLTPPIREGSEMPLGGSGSQSEKVSTPLPYVRGRGVGLLPSGRGEGVGLLLRERDWGGFTGRFIPDLKDEVWPDDIETLDALQARARQFLDFIRQQYPDKTVLAVGHGIINKAIQAVFYKKAMREVPRMANAEIRILDL
jgi:probable phosphoglycerate mutase